MVRRAVFAALIVLGSIIGSQWGIEGICVAILIINVACYPLYIHLSNKIVAVGWLAFAQANLPAVLLAMLVLGVLILGEKFVWHDVQSTLQFPIEAVATGVVLYAACIIKPDWFLGPDGIWLLREIRQHAPARLRGLFPNTGVPTQPDSN